MQNKGAIQVFAILLTLACLWQLSFTFVTRNVESKAAEETGGDPQKELAYLDSMKSEKVWLGLYTYDECKKREISLGLDLKGGMNVTLEVSIPELLRKMANNSTDSAFNKALVKAKEQQKTSQKSFVDLFVDEYVRLAPNGKLSSSFIFGHKDQSLIKGSNTNEEVRAILNKEADNAIDRTYEVLNSRIDQFGVTQPNLQKLEGMNRILVELPGVKDPARVQDLLVKQAKLEFYITYENKEVFDNLVAIDTYLAAIEKNSTSKDSVVDTNKVSNPITQPETSDNDSIKNDTLKSDTAKGGGKFGGKDSTNNPLFNVLSPAISQDNNGQQFYTPGSTIGYSRITDTAKVMSYFRMSDVIKKLPKDIKLAWEHKPNEGGFLSLHALKMYKGKPALGGDVIEDAEVSNNDGTGIGVTMKMNNDGSNQWAQITDANVGKYIAIVLDDKVYSAPVVNQKITGGISSISGGFTSDEAKSLASVLKAGKLPVSLEVVEQAVVGPSLGKKAINAGLLSLLVAFLLILVYMVFYYGKAGLVANIALFTNVFFLIGSLASLNAILTLPGIAGLVLTIGMAVDANVLIFERVKEELRLGKRLKIALDEGYKRALSAIIDSNLTTLLTALILIVFGAGPVRGFAVVLFIGILTSMFTAIFISRLVFEFALSKNWNVNFSTKVTENFMRDPKFNFVGRRKVYYIISGVLIAISIASFATKQFNLGIDLKGGRSYTIQFDQSVNQEELQASLNQKFTGVNTMVKFYGSNDRVKVITPYKGSESGITVDNEIEKLLYEGSSSFFASKPTVEDFIDKDGNGIVESFKVGPTVARDVKTKSVYAVVLSLVMIFLYVLFRFKGWQYGLGALIALIHDVVIVLGMFSLLDGILPFSLEVDQAIIAAILTVIGYSINDTVIIFDRIREYIGEGRKGDQNTLINSALNSTLGRTINTSLTVFIVLIITFLFGGEGVRGFAFAILIGVIVGTYSSIFIATPVVIDLKKDKTGLKS